MSFLQINQADLISGNYEGEVGKAVAHVLDALPKRPRVIQLYVNCIDDFLGTDGETLLAGLKERFPYLRFSLSHINPIAADLVGDGSCKMHSGLLELLEDPPIRDLGVSTFGSFEPLPTASEFTAALAAVGAGPVRHIVLCDTFEEYQKLAASSLALCVSRRGNTTAQSIANRFGMRYLTWTATYDLHAVDTHYRELATVLDLSAAELNNDTSRNTQLAMKSVLEPARTAAVAAVKRALSVVDNVPVVVSSDASFSPFELAFNLLEYGFDIRVVLALHMKGADEEAEHRLLAAYPNVHVIRETDVNAIQGIDEASEWLSIGTDAAFLLGAVRVVDMYHDEGYFGYQGIKRLMNEMADAMEGTAIYTKDAAKNTTVANKASNKVCPPGKEEVQS